MRSLLKSRRVRMVALVALLSCYPVWYATAYPRGMLVAYVDHARGHREVQAYGYPAPWLPEYSRLLKEGYDVELHPVAGCVVSPRLAWYVAGYNSVSVRAIEREHGPGVFEQCHALAKKKWRDEHPEEFEGGEAQDVP